MFLFSFITELDPYIRGICNFKKPTSKNHRIQVWKPVTAAQHSKYFIVSIYTVNGSKRQLALITFAFSISVIHTKHELWSEYFTLQPQRECGMKIKEPDGLFHISYCRGLFKPHCVHLPSNHPHIFSSLYTFWLWVLKLSQENPSPPLAGKDWENKPGNAFSDPSN